MSVTNQATQTVTALGDGTTVNFTIGFTFQDNADVHVFLQDQTTTPYVTTEVIQGTGSSKFTISGGDPGTTIVMGTAPSTTQLLVIQRIMAFTQTVDYVETDAFPATDHEAQMDKQVLLLQQMESQVSRGIIAPNSLLPSWRSVIAGLPLIPNSVLAIDTDGLGVQQGPTIDVLVSGAAAAAASATSAASAAASAATAQTAATSASTSATASATSATASATSATASATSAATSATAAAASAASALSSTLPSGQIIVGSVSNVATGVSPSGDVTISDSGAIAVTAVGGSTAANVHAAEGLVNGSQSGSKVFASPSGGGSGAPTFRALVAGDVPTLNQSTTGTASNVTGTVAIANGGTGQTAKTAAFDALQPMSASGDIIYGGTSGSGTRLAKGSDGQVLTLASGLPSWGTGIALKAPTLQTFSSTGTQQGWMLTVTSANATVGATYTNNGHSFTIQGTISAGTSLFVLGAGSLSGTTLTKSAGTGDATITFSASAATGLYVTPAGPAPLYIRVRIVGGGGGGGGSSTGAANNGGTGGSGLGSFFGANFLLSAGGAGGGQFGVAGGSGGAASVGSGTIGGMAFSGTAGSPGQGWITLGSEFPLGGSGGSSPFGGAGAGGTAGSQAGNNAVTNTGSGGGGSGGSQGVFRAASGGGAGAYIDVTITSLASGYPYIVGAGGAAGTAGTTGTIGGTGASGLIEVFEHYQ